MLLQLKARPLGSKAGRAHSRTEGELLGHSRWKDLDTGHGHEVGDAPRGKQNSRQEAPGVEDGQSVQSNYQPLKQRESGRALLDNTVCCFMHIILGPSLTICEQYRTRASKQLEHTVSAPSHPSVRSSLPYPASSPPVCPN